MDIQDGLYAVVGFLPVKILAPLLPPSFFDGYPAFARVTPAIGIDTGLPFKGVTTGPLSANTAGQSRQIAD